MMTRAELEFLVKMRDEASASFRKLTDAIDKAAKGADELGDANDEAANSFDDLIKKAKEATVAIGGVFLAFKGSQKAIGVFSGYEDELLKVQRLTKQSREEMVGYADQLRNTEINLGGIDPKQFRSFVATGGQLGLAADEAEKFGATLIKLDQALDLGDAGAISIGRLLNMTGDLRDKGGAAVTEFGNALAQLQLSTKASATEMVTMASGLAQGTAQFELGSTTLLGLAAAFTQLDLRVGASSSSMLRVFGSLDQAAKLGGEAMRALTRETGVTRDELLKMMETDPSKALFTLLEAIDKIRKEGRSTAGFLAEMGLQGNIDEKTLSTLASNLDEVEKKVKAAREAAGQGGVFDDMFKDAQQNVSAFTQDMSNAFKRLTQDVGQALAPIYTTVTSVITGALNIASAAFRAVPEWGRTVIATGALITVGLGPAMTAIRLIGPVVSAAAGSFNLFKTAGTVVKGALGVIPASVRIATGALKLLPAAANLTVSAFRAIPAAVRTARTALLSLTEIESIQGGFAAARTAVLRLVASLRLLGRVPVLGIVGAIAGAAAAVYTYWDDIKEAFSNGMTYVRETLSSWWNKGKKLVADVAVDPDIKSAKEAGEQIKKEVEEKVRNVNIGIAQKDLDIFKSFIPDVGDMVELRKQKGVIDDFAESLRKLREDGQGGKLINDDGVEITQEQVDRARRLLEIRQRMAADPLFSTVRGLEDQLDDAAAVNVELKNQLELHRAIRDAVEETGLSYEEVEDRLKGTMDQLQRARQQTALADQFRDIDHSIRMAGARTAQEEQRLEVLKKINDFEREHGKLGDADRASLEQRLNLLNQMTNAKRLLEQLDPVGSAQQRYQAELKTLQVLRDQNIISAEMYGRMAANLDRQTFSSRDPVGSRIKEMREELHLMQYTGKQHAIEQQVLQETNRLKDQGVQVTGEMTQALREYATAMQQAKDAQTQGLAGWAEQVGTLEDNLSKLTHNFADGLADAISGAISGDAGSFRKFAANLGKQMVNMAVRQMMADAIKGFGNPQKDAAMSRADAALAKLDALNNAGINAPQATVNAGTVNLNGQIPGVPGESGASPLDPGYARQEFPELKAVNDNLSQVKEVVPQIAAANDNLVLAQKEVVRATQGLSETIGGPGGVQKTVEQSLSTLPSVDVKPIELKPAQIPEVKIPEISLPPVKLSQSQMPKVQMPKLRGDELQAYSGLAGSNSLDIGPQMQAFNQSINTQAQKALEVATTQLGNHEVFNRTAVNDFLKAGGQKNIDAAQTAWCGAFVNSSLEQVGIKGLQGNNKYIANQYRKWGQGVDPKDVMPGDVLVQHRGRGFTRGGHVGLATGNKRMNQQGELELQMLSGNARNRVQYDWHKAKGLDVRRATENELPKVDPQALQQGQQQMQQYNQQLQQTGTSAQTAVQPMQQLQQTTEQTGQSVQSVQQPMQNLQQSSQMTNGSLNMTGQSVSQFGQQTQMAGTSVQQAAPSMSMLGTNTMQAGSSATQAGQQFQQAGSQIQSAGAQASSAGSQAGGASNGFGGLEGALGGLMGPINQATGGLGSLAQSIISFISQIGSSSPGGGGGLFGGLFGLFGFAEGGQIKGKGTGTSDSILAAVSNGEFIVNAEATKKNLPLLHALNDNKKLDVPAFKSGGLVAGNSSKIKTLNLGEKALGRSATKQQDQHVARLTDQVNRLTKVAAGGGVGQGHVTNQAMNVTVNARDAGSFRASEGQLMADAQIKMQRMARRNG